MNNELGTITDIDSIGELTRNRGIIFHVDAAQSIGKIPISMSSNKIDLLSEEQFQKLENITKRSKNIFPVSSKDMIGVDKLIDGIDLILSENFISETLRFGFDKTSYRAKLYDISIVESEKLYEEGYEISVRWSEKRRGEFFHYINSSEI